MPIVLPNMSKQWIARGNIIKVVFSSTSNPASLLKLAPNIIALRISAEIDSNKSAAYPAQSPTLSPTRSAMTAGFLASSSGIFDSTLPIKSAPTSAA